MRSGAKSNDSTKRKTNSLGEVHRNIKFCVFKITTFQEVTEYAYGHQKGVIATIWATILDAPMTH
jgi:hypothetical protein